MGSVDKLRIGPEIWSREVVDDQGETGAFCSVAADNQPQPRPHISYWTNHESPRAVLRWARRDSEGQWTIEDVDRVRGAGSSLAIDSKGTPWIAYYDLTASALKVARRENSSWRSEVVVPGLRGFAVGSTSLVLVEDAPHVSYWSDAGLQLAVRRQAGWSVEANHIDRSETAGIAHALAVSRAGVLEASYYDLASQSLLHARRSGVTWTARTVDDGRSGFAGEHNTLVIQSAPATTHVGYWMHGGLRYARRSGSAAFRTEVVETGFGAGMYPSIAMNRQGIPHIAYRDADRGLLRLARRINDVWRSIDLDQGIEAAFTSLAIDAADVIHIAYQDAPAQRLKFAALVPSPRADFRKNQGIDRVELDATVSTGDGLRFQWTFGPTNLRIEGSVTDAKIQVIRAVAPGNVEARLTVTDAHGRSDTKPPQGQPGDVIRL
jgi:hypothetical protein